MHQQSPSLQPGDVIRVWCVFFWHYGVYLGDDQVMVHAGPSRGGRVCRQWLCDFAAGGVVRLVPGDYTREVSFYRALWAEGRSGYNLFTANCEHFAMWCATGRSFSGQIVVALQSLLLGLGLWATVGFARD